MKGISVAPYNFYAFEKTEFLVTYAALDSSVQELVQWSLRPTILYFGTIFDISRSFQQTSFVKRRSGDVYSPNMTVKSYCSVESGRHCPRIGEDVRHQRNFERFIPSRPSELGSVGILRPRQQPKSSRQRIVINTYGKGISFR